MLGADREIAQLLGPGIDDLVRGFFAAGRAGDNVARAYGISCFANSYFAATLQYEEHLLLGRVIVKWPRAFTRRDGGDVIPKSPRADARADYSRSRLEALRSGSSRCPLRWGLFERDISDIHYRLGHDVPRYSTCLDDATHLAGRSDLPFLCLSAVYRR